MEEQAGSRRTFLVGGAAAAAILGPLAIASATQDGVAPLWKPAAPKSALSDEIAKWLRNVGIRFTVQGEAGTGVATLSAVMQPPVDLNRPASLGRQSPFMLYFELDARLAPKGQKIYRIVRADGHVYQMFLGRGADGAGKAVLTALFN